MVLGMDSMLEKLRHKIREAAYADERLCLQQLIELTELTDLFLTRAKEKSHELAQRVRETRKQEQGLSAFLHAYDLTSQEGVALMCVAEALLRIPDSATQDRLIEDKIVGKNWARHSGRSHALLVNTATQGLRYVDHLLREKKQNSGMTKWLNTLAAAGRPVIRLATIQSVKMLGREFIVGETIHQALKTTTKVPHYRYSYDMLGETAKTAQDAERYYLAYQEAIEAVGQSVSTPIEGPGVSVKLSALHPRYEWAKTEQIREVLLPRVKNLALLAKAKNIGLTIDAEESYRLEPSLDVFAELMRDPELAEWEGLGLAVQAYLKRASAVVDWLIALAQETQRKILVRLVKGAYWDTEIKWAQERGLSDYPVFTRKSSTDVSYFVCAQKLLQAKRNVYPQFATHNAYTVASVLELAQGNRDFEFQCLYGMGNSLYDYLVSGSDLGIHCRVYAPVGNYKDLLSYLIRRLLENGASTSFVHRITDEKVDLDKLLTDPVVKTQSLTTVQHPKLPLPSMLYGEKRRNASGLDVNNPMEIFPMQDQIKAFFPSLFDQKLPSHTVEDIEVMLAQAAQAFVEWDNTPIDTRANCLEKMSDLLEANRAQLMALLIKEAGKTIQDALSEVREAVDFCRYYALRVREDFAPQILPGPTGEDNRLSLHGRGVIACISPWNFPLAIFLGQITAALAAGNSVLAKPAGQTPYIAHFAIDLLHKAGIPKSVVQLMLIGGRSVGEHLIPDPRIKGVMLTGSTETARSINCTLAERSGPMVPFIAETGGQNAMIVDASAFPEQVISDVMLSAFGSAGQRCSALRVLFLPESIADDMIIMLKGAMQELTIGDPFELSTDIGPVIDSVAAEGLNAHMERMDKEAIMIHKCHFEQSEPLAKGILFSPCAYEISNITILTEEVFGPVLHVIRYASTDLDQVIDSINGIGYGLTLGIHSRIDKNIRYICERVRVGNTYVNRNMIGAVVGVQPFGGEGLSGTGPKAGGPHLLPRLAVERTVSINTTAVGGNSELVSLEE